MSEISSNPPNNPGAPSALANNTGSQSIVTMTRQGQVSTLSGNSYPPDIVSETQLEQNLQAIEGYQNSSAPPSASQFRQLTEAQLRQMIDQGNSYSVKSTTNNIYGVNREPWIFAVFEDLIGAPDLSNIENPPQTTFDTVVQSIQVTDSQKALFWVANPKSVSWQINQRGTEVKNKSGTVLHIWRDRTRNSDFDDPKITMQFQSGNIMPNTGDATSFSQNQLGISGGLNNFYDYLKLVDRSKLTTDGKANLVHIFYRSRIFPSLILTGFFDPQAVVQFTDDSQNPFQVSSWQATFTVYSTVPKINDAKQLATIFSNDGLAGFYGEGNRGTTNPIVPSINIPVTK
jgi:hypothetical protein